MLSLALLPVTSIMLIKTFLRESPFDRDTRLCSKLKMTYLIGDKPVSKECNFIAKQRSFIHAQYLNCFTFDPEPHLRTKLMSVEVYLHLNEMPEHVTCPDCFLMELKSQLSGALLAIHANDQLPIINHKSINLKPGSLTEVRLATYQHVQKQPPYGQCDMNVPSALHLYDSSFDYSEYGCLEATKQSNIIKKCGCYGLEMPYNELDGIPPCLRLPSFIDQSFCNLTDLRNGKNGTAGDQCMDELAQFVNRIRCKQKVMESYVRRDKMTCAMPCSFYSYETELSTSYWPTKSMQLTWLNSSFGKKLGFHKDSRFSAYKRAQALLLQGNLSLAGEILANANALERNLVAVLINRPNFDVHKVEEKEVLSTTSMLSQTGGLFSMWIGFTFISVVEILELIAKCLVKVTEHIGRRRKRSSDYCSQQTTDYNDWKADDLNKEQLAPVNHVGNHCLPTTKCRYCCVHIFPHSNTDDVYCKIFPLDLHPKHLPKEVCEHSTKMETHHRLDCSLQNALNVDLDLPVHPHLNLRNISTISGDARLSSSCSNDVPK